MPLQVYKHGPGVHGPGSWSSTDSLDTMDEVKPFFKFAASSEKHTRGEVDTRAQLVWEGRHPWSRDRHTC